MNQVLLKTPIKTSESVYREKGSKFLGFLVPVLPGKNLKSIIKKFSMKYHDAAHLCYAYRVLSSSEPYIIERKSDAGEPSGTAGSPILQKLKEKQIVNAVIIVVRYFGGTKLGKGNLARAYGICAGEVVTDSKLTTIVINTTFTIEIEQTLIGQLENLIYKNGGEIVSRKFIHNGEKSLLKIEIPKVKYRKIRTSLFNKFSKEFYFYSSNSD